MDEQVRKYNTLIRELLDMISADLPGNKMVETIRRRFRVALACDRTYILEETSPEMLEYRDIIAEERWDDLIYKDWESEIDKKNDDLMYEIDNRSLRDMISLLRSLWETYDEEQKTFVKKSMKRLLSYCVKYLRFKADGKQ